MQACRGVEVFRDISRPPRGVASGHEDKVCKGAEMRYVRREDEEERARQVRAAEMGVSGMQDDDSRGERREKKARAARRVPRLAPVPVAAAGRGVRLPQEDGVVLVAVPAYRDGRRGAARHHGGRDVPAARQVPPGPCRRADGGGPGMAVVRA